MNDVDSESGTGLRAGKTSRTSDANFECDDSEWDVGIRINDCIINLDADIEKSNEANNSPTHSNNSPPTSLPSPMHIPPTSSTSSSSSKSNSPSNTASSNPKGKSSNAAPFAPKPGVGPPSGENMEQHSASLDKGLKVKIKRTKTGTKSGAGAEHEIVKSSDLSRNNANAAGGSSESSSISPKLPHPSSSSSKGDKEKIKDGVIMIDAEGIGVSNHGAAATANNGVANNKEAGNADKKAPRKGKEPHNKKLKNGNSGKKEERAGGSGNATPETTTKNHTATVSLNVPTPNVLNASSAFSKTTLKVPTTSSPSNPSLASLSSNHGSLSNSSSSSWGIGSPSKSVGDKSLSDKSQGNGSPSFGKKVRPGDKNNKEDGPHLGVSSFRNTSDIGSSISATVNHHGPIQKISRPPVSTHDQCVGTSVGTITDPDCLGPCEPGTSVTLEGIVWHENQNGILVVNVTWRGKTYVGTLIDCTKQNDWAPPRFCDSPTSDLEMRTTKNRTKWSRGQAATPVNEVQSERGGNPKLRNGAKGRRGSAPNAAFVTPASPLKSEQLPKRKTRGSETDSQDEPTGKSAKRLKTSKGERRDRQSNSPVLPDLDKPGGPSSPALIECPEPNCSKKYKHINGLRYHQSHAHNNFNEDSDSNASTTSTQLATPTDVGDRPGSEPMICDTDGDVEDSKTSPEESTEGEDPSPSVVKSAKSGKVAKDVDGDSKSLDVQNKEALTTTPRAPILTVPVVPFTSLQNRVVPPSTSVSSGHVSQEPPVMKPTPISASSPILQAKGVPWQPHVHNPLANPHLQSGGVTTLNIPSAPTGDKSKDKSLSSSDSHGKKNKHKKKSKEKDKEGKSKADSKSDKSKLDKHQKDKPPSTGSAPPSHDESSAAQTRDFHGVPTPAPGNPGEGRDDPQSPAYSDISDANDSGDGELNVVLGKDGKGDGISDLKKDGVPVSPYYSSFYSPYMDSNKLGDHKPSGLSPEEIEKLKTKGVPVPPGTGPNPPSSNPDKMDYPHSKFLPQQHYFPYPYSNISNYHLGSYNGDAMMDPARGFSSSSEEKEKELAGDLSKGGKFPDRDGIIIKQEPGLEKERKSESEPHKHCSKHSKEASMKGEGKGSKDDIDKEKMKEREEGSKPTMETTGPPPPPTAGSYPYGAQPYGSPFGLHFDPGHPLYRQVLGPYGANPYMHPSSMPRYPPPPGGATPLPEDLSRAPTAPPVPAGGALSTLAHHASQYYQHKIHELQERALKSPSPQVGPRESPREPSANPTSSAGGPPGGPRSQGSASATSPSVSKPADLSSKDTKPPPNESSRSPPTHVNHHVHSHTHYHTVGIAGFPIIPAYPAPHSPHYGVLPTAPAAPVIPPFPSQKPN